MWAAPVQFNGCATRSRRAVIEVRAAAPVQPDDLFNGVQHDLSGGLIRLPG